MTDRYIGPSAARIADLIPHRVSFDRGWFWTTTAICHGGRSDGLAFRQRPDGEGIDVRCHTRGCTRGLVITHLEALVGLPIWTAYEPVGNAPSKSRWRKWWTPKRIVVAGVVALVVAAPLLLGHGPEAAIPQPGRSRRRRTAGLASHPPHQAVGSLVGRLHYHPNRKGRLHHGGGPSSLPETGLAPRAIRHRHYGKEDTMVAQQDITLMARFGAPLCQGCGHELDRDEIGTVCDLCIAEEIAGRYASRKDKSVCRYGSAGRHEHGRPGGVLALAGHGGHDGDEARRAHKAGEERHDR